MVIEAPGGCGGPRTGTDQLPAFPVPISRRTVEGVAITGCNPRVAPLSGVPRVLAVGGGYPLFEDGEAIGAIGVSGGNLEQDQQAALEASCTPFAPTPRPIPSGCWSPNGQRTVTGVRSTWGDMRAQVYRLAQRLLDHGVLLDWLPWSHTFGGNFCLGMVLTHGGQLWIDDGRPAPTLIDKTVRNLTDVHPTVYLNVPAGWAALLPHLERDTDAAGAFFDRLRIGFFAAAALPQQPWDRIEKLAAHHSARMQMTTAWRLTETAPAVTAPVKANGHRPQVVTRRLVQAALPSSAGREDHNQRRPDGVPAAALCRKAGDSPTALGGAGSSGSGSSAVGKRRSSPRSLSPGISLNLHCGLGSLRLTTRPGM